MPVRFRITLIVMVLESIAQAVIFRRILKLCSKHNHFRLVKSALWVVGVGMLVGSLSDFDFLEPLFNRLPASWTGALRTTTALWAFSSTAALVIHAAVMGPVRSVSRRLDPERRAVLRVISGAVVAAPFIATAAGVLVERTRLEVTELSLKLKGLPKEFDGFRILQLSDIHLSPYLSEATLVRVVDLSNELQPDVAFVTGDLITAKGDPLDACLRQLARLRASAGILGCLGNHEIYCDAEEYAYQTGAKLGIRFLRGRRETIVAGKGRLHVSGVDYQPFERRANYLQGAEKLLVPKEVSILLSHNPDVFPTAARMGFDLVLAGHTHGGQVTTEILQQTLNPARIITPYVRGLYERQSRYCYVNRGIGTLGIPARLACPPEITVIQLARA